MTKLWRLKSPAPTQWLKNYPRYHPLVLQLLYNRCLTEESGIEKFFSTNYDQGLSSPFLFKDMKKATMRIWQAIENKEKICIYGDYDADAITANAILRQTFRYLNVTVESYIPDRFSEGYGINLQALEKIKSLGVNLIITVDCGANAVAAARACEAGGIDLIITDHHEILGELPKALALINPKNAEDSYPDSQITGAGVAFKLACGILSDKERVSQRLHKAALRLRSRQPATYVAGWEKWLLDLVAIGTVADCHSLLGENRTLVKYGLKVLTKSRWVGLKALCAKAGLDFSQKSPDTYTLGFIIAPHLNAAGRLEHASIALNLLLETNLITALEKASVLESLNQKRQKLTSMVLSEAKTQAQVIKERKILALMGGNWPKGIVGLVAGKIAEEFCRPTIVLEKGETEASGSARTVGNFNIVEALKYTSEFLLKFGGHKQAAGLTLKTEHFEIFYQKLLEYAETNLTSYDLQPVLELESELLEDNLQLTTYNLLTGFEPFGIDNPRPKFLITDSTVIALRVVGSLRQHLQMQLRIGKKEVPAIAFNFGSFAENLKVGDNLDIACELIRDEWHGQQKVKLRVIDIKLNKVTI